MFELYEITIVPILFGLLLISVIIQVLVLWQLERSWRVASFLLLFVSLTLLYLVAAAQLPLYWREVGHIGFVIGMLGGNYFRGRELLIFLKEKEELRTVDAQTSSETGATNTQTLKSMSAEGEPARLDATDATKSNVVETPVVSK